jgi:hypothetical protein
MKLVGLPKPQDASPEIKVLSTYISHKNGGKGAAMRCDRASYESTRWINSILTVNMIKKTAFSYSGPVLA